MHWELSGPHRIPRQCRRDQRSGFCPEVLSAPLGQHTMSPMPSVFSLIINGDLPGHFVWSDDVCVSFLSINPITDGHALVVPRTEIDQWTDVDVDDAAHMMRVAHHLGTAIKTVFSPERVGLMIAGFEVPHTHLHVSQLNDMSDMSFANAASTVDHGQLAGFAASIRAQLESAGHQQVADAP